MKIERIETLACDAGWRNYHFLKLITDDGVVGWSEFDEDFGPPGLATVIERYAARLIGEPVHEVRVVRRACYLQRGGWRCRPFGGHRRPVRAARCAGQGARP